MPLTGSQPFSVLLCNFKRKWTPGWTSVRLGTGMTPVPSTTQVPAVSLEPGWSSLQVFDVGGKTFLFLLNQETGDVRIRALNADGSVGTEVERYRWSTGWTTASFYRAGGHTYLFLLKAGNGHVHIHRMNADGSVGPEVERHDWSSGWTTAAFYEAGGSTYLFLLKESNGHVHIHRMNADGSVGPEVERHDWSSGWTSIHSYEHGGTPYLVMIKAATGDLHIHELNPDGSVGTRVEDGTVGGKGSQDVTAAYTVSGTSYLFTLDSATGRAIINELGDAGSLGDKVFDTDWSSGWTAAACHDSSQGPRLLLYKRASGQSKTLPLDLAGTFIFMLKQEGGEVRCRSIHSSGLMAGENWSSNWTSGWTTAEFFRAGGKRFLFLLKEQNGIVHTHTINAQGGVGPRVDERHWSGGWTTARFYEAGGATYLFLLKEQTGDVHIHRMNADGSVGQEVERRRWSSGWTTAAFYQVGGRTCLFLLKEGDGHVHVHVMNADGSVGAEIERHEWSTGWTTAAFYRVGGTTYLFLLKAGNGHVHIHQMNTDGSVGPEVERHDWSNGWTSVTFYEAKDQTYLSLLKAANGAGHLHEMNGNGGVGRRIDPDEPFSRAYYEQLITRTGAGSVADYWKEVSRGTIDLTGSVVKGWYTLPVSWEEMKRHGRGKKISESIRLIEHAPSDAYTVPGGHRVIVIHNQLPDSGASGSRVLGHPAGRQEPSFLCHEMGHTFGLVHAYSNDSSRQNAGWSSPGEYDDPWDIMGSPMTFTVALQGQSVQAGCGPQAHHLLELGWLAADEVLEVTAPVSSVAIGSLSAGGMSGRKVLRIPIAQGRYYLVEYRTPDAWDRGFGADVVLIHEVKTVTKNGGTFLRPFLLRDTDQSGRPPLQAVTDGSAPLLPEVLSVDAAARTARIRVRRSSG